MLYQISSGQGPAECELGVSKFADYLISNYKGTKIVSVSGGQNKNTYRSMQIESETDLSHFVGSILWICKSPYRPSHKRKNWFLDFSVCTRSEAFVFDEKQIHFESIKSRGNGGQNINKVETGIRATYIPTRDTVVCMENRKQLLNKHKAVLYLRSALEKRNAELTAKDKDFAWSRHTQIKRGNAVAAFKGDKFVSVQ